ncbi:hypothetical protein TNCV_1552831 [Trichonephila clavipes]|nr:hypothetical protein TNCV_1552831 [Trichonephila clavipes]
MNDASAISRHRGCLGVKVMSSCLACHEFDSRTVEDLPCKGAMHEKSGEAQTSSRWSGVEVRRGGFQLRCHPRHLIMAQNYEVRRQ